jgi:hypothetical protein
VGRLPDPPSDPALSGGQDTWVPSLALGLANSTTEIRRALKAEQEGSGLIVTQLRRVGPGALAGLKVGDLITHAGTKRLVDVADLATVSSPSPTSPLCCHNRLRRTLTVSGSEYRAIWTSETSIQGVLWVARLARSPWGMPLRERNRVPGQIPRATQRRDSCATCGSVQMANDEACSSIPRSNLGDSHVHRRRHTWNDPCHRTDRISRAQGVKRTRTGYADSRRIHQNEREVGPGEKLSDARP